MPPHAKITREMIIEAAFEIVRQNGVSELSARSVAQKLGCSTQPVMYHFKRIDDLKKAVYLHADGFHSAYITDIQPNDAFAGIGLRYIRFAYEEKHLFRFLFQSDSFSNRTLTELIDAPELEPVLKIFAMNLGIDREKSKEVFRMIFLFVHGYASMFANNSMLYDEGRILADLKSALDGFSNKLRGEL